MILHSLSVILVYAISSCYLRCDAYPRPCQFLPVAVKLEYPPDLHKLKSSPPVKNEEENQITSQAEKNNNDLLLPEVSEKLPTNVKADAHMPKPEKEDRPKILRTFEISTENQLLKRSSESSNKPKRRIQKDPKNVILNQNVHWMLKTINDKPAEEVLVTDKASFARDLGDATESALVKVRKLEIS